MLHFKLFVFDIFNFCLLLTIVKHYFADSLSDDKKTLSVVSDKYGYLFTDLNNLSSDVIYVKKIISLIHSQQHPPKETCKHRRLLVTQFADSFEGLGSILKLVMLGLAEAAHSNRTLIWGIDMPYLFERSREVWYDEINKSGKRVVNIKGLKFDCGSYSDGSGPYTCFFQPLSSCTIYDVTIEELLTIGSEGFNDETRVKIQDERRSPAAAYHYPIYNPHYRNLVDYSSFSIPYLRHKWAAALQTYIFRLKPDVLKLLKQKETNIYPNSMGGNSQFPTKNCDLFCSSQSIKFNDIQNHDIGDEREESFMNTNNFMMTNNLSNSHWGVHIRHGDLLSLKTVYGNREVYEFDDYIDAILYKVNKLIDENEVKYIPSSIYISSDSTKLNDFITNTCNYDTGIISKWPFLQLNNNFNNNNFNNNNDDVDIIDKNNDLNISCENISTHKLQHKLEKNIVTIWGPPCIFTVDPLERFRTDHGSHTVAAGGGCQGQTCAMQWWDIINYQNDENYNKLSKPLQMLIVLYEAIEDIYLLSQSNIFIGTLSSHFSTVVALLVWAKNGVENPLRDVYILDELMVKKGNIESSFLLRPLNRTDLLERDQGHERWIHHTRLLLEGLSHINITISPYEIIVGENPLYRVYMEEYLPTVSQFILEKETYRWMGNPIYGKIWPGECDRDEYYIKKIKNMKEYDKLVTEMVSFVNWGAEQSSRHPNQAMRCWKQAKSLLIIINNYIKKKYIYKKDKVIFDSEEILNGNVKALMAKEYYPYGYGKKKLMEILEIVADVDLFRSNS